MSLLHLTVPAYGNELLGSLCSRTAATNGIESAHLFARDMSFSFVKMRGGVERDLTRFSDLVGISHEVLASMPRIHEGLLTWNGHSIRKLDVCQTARFCPDCMLAADDGRRPEIGQYQRVEWAIEAVEACMVHGTRLVTSVRPIDHFHRFDLCAVLRSEPNLWKTPGLADRIDDLVGRQIVDRLYGVTPGPTWADTLSLNAIILMSGALGTTLRNGSGARFRHMSERDRGQARREGLQLLKEGRTAVVDHVRQLARALPGKRKMSMRSHTLFGELQMIATRTRGNKEFDGLRDILSEVNEEMLSKPTTPAITAVAAEVGMHRKQLRSLLSLRGLDIESVRPLIGDGEAIITEHLGRTMSRRDAAKFLDIPLPHLDGLIRLGIISSVADDAGEVELDVANLRDVLKRVRSCAAGRSERGRTDLEAAAKLVRCTPEHMLELLLRCRLATAHLVKKTPGYRAIKVDPLELSELTYGPLEGGVPFYKVRRRLAIGLEDAHALLENGYLPTQSRLHPLTGCPVSVVCYSALDDFCGRYVSLEQICRSFKDQPSKLEVASWLEERGMKPAFPPDRLSKLFFLRSAI
ncbi:TniQ family protein [Rhizobium ruizarguesonis]